MESNNNVIWDYSEIPPREWKWEYDPDTNITVKLSATGLDYHGEDDYFGGYIVGFQSFEVFFRDGPLKNMPEKVAVELREHLETHRKSGGAFLQFHYTNSAEPLKLWRAFVGMDEKTIHAQGNRLPSVAPEDVFFAGSCTIGKHKFNIALVFEDGSKYPVEKWIFYCKFNITLMRNCHHTLELETTKFHETNIEAIVTLNEDQIPIFDSKLKRYYSN